MAARKFSPQHDAATRLKIQTSQLVNRLSDHANGKVDLQPTQVKAIEILLRKVLPDLQAIEGTLNVTHHHEDVLRDLEAAVLIQIEDKTDAAYH